MSETMFPVQVILIFLLKKVWLYLDGSTEPIITNKTQSK